MTDLDPDTPITEALALLRRELDQKTDDGTPPPHGLRPKEISRNVAVFQPRELRGNLAEDEQHISVLVKAIGDPKKPRMLDPILVWWSGARWIVIDGHHRLLAYHRAGVTAPVPLEVFRGSLEEAVGAAAAANSKNKLPMSEADKLNMAWRLTVHFPERSKRKVARDCSISERSVANMREALGKLRARGVAVEDIPDNWKDAKRDADGDERDADWDADAARRKREDYWAKAILRSCGKPVTRDPEALALALRTIDDRLPKRLIDTHEWSDVVDESLSERDESEPDY